MGRKQRLLQAARPRVGQVWPSVSTHTGGRRPGGGGGVEMVLAKFKFVLGNSVRTVSPAWNCSVDSVSQPFVLGRTEETLRLRTRTSAEVTQLGSPLFSSLLVQFTFLSD